MLPTPINNTANPQDNSSNDPANNSRQNRGTGFTNIGDILNANQGAGERIGQAVGQSIAGQANSVKAGIDSSQNQFNTDKNTATTNANNAIQAGNQYTRQAGESTDAYSSRLNGSGSTPTDYSAIGKNLSTAAYNGPSTLNNSEQIQSQASNVNALGRLAGTADGQSQLIRSQVAQNGQYSTGQNTLDSLLLGNSGQQYLQPAMSQAAQVGNLASNAISNSSAQANAAKSAIDNNRVSTLHDLQSSLTGTGTKDPTANPNGITGLETDATKAATGYTNQAQRLQQLIAGKDANGNIISANGTGTAQLTDSDKALLQNMGQFGVSGNNFYADPNNSAATRSALGNFAANLTTNGLGNQLYTDPQRSAAINLAKLLQDNQSQTDIANQTFNKNIQSDTQRQQANTALGNLSNGINSSISSDQAKAAGLQALSQQYSPYDNIDSLFNQTTGNLHFHNSAQYDDLSKRFQALTGQDIGSLSDNSANKRISDLISRYIDPANQESSTLSNQLTNNTTSIQNAVLQRLLAGQ